MASPHATLTVTFDANTLEAVARPERRARDPFHASYVSIQRAIKDGFLKGYFSQTYCTLEGIQGEDRSAVLGKTHVRTSSRSPDRNTVNIRIEIRRHRKPLHMEHNAALQAVLQLGIRALRRPARMVDGLVIKDPDNTIYVNESVEQVIKHRGIANEVASAIESRGVGRAVALELGPKFNEHAGVTGELWLQGLARAKSDELRLVRKANGLMAMPLPRTLVMASRSSVLTTWGEVQAARPF
ncbi:MULTISPECIES: hypothetical protein [Paraburkholderia]|uniref:hypothetical protein n=1 Tax=Paraburkholderia TaxID=1822464 RepID=UPI0038BC1959